jgi:hypothetical protein
MEPLTIAIFLFAFGYANLSEFAFRSYHSGYSIKRVALRALCFIVIMAVLTGIII